MPRWPLLLAVALLGGCAQYQIGADTLYPAHIRTVYVPVFRSASFRRDLGERLTEAVVKEIEAKTPFKVVSAPDADSILTGEIVSDSKHMLVVTPDGDPREDEVGVQVRVNWIDRAGGALRSDMQVPFDSGPMHINSTAKVVPEVGQSTVTGQQQAICKAAQQIVAMMEAPW